MSKCVGSWKPATINKIRSHVGEMLLDNLVETEVLFYVLTDVIGLSNLDAKFMTLLLKKSDGFGGGKVFNGDDVSNIICDEWTAYGINSKQASRFINWRYKSTRIIEISKKPYVWEFNGFGTNQPPYIAGFERGISS